MDIERSLPRPPMMRTAGLSSFDGTDVDAGSAPASVSAAPSAIAAAVEKQGKPSDRERIVCLGL